MLLVFLLLSYTLLLLLLALVSGMETATFSVRDIQQALSRETDDDLRAEVQGILANPFHHLHRTLLVSATLNLALTALVLYLVTVPLRQQGWNPWWTAALAFSLIVLLGDVLPKFMAARYPVSILFLTTRLLRPVRKLIDPLTLLAERVSDKVLRTLLPTGLKPRQPITQEELETLIEMREEQGAVSPMEAAMLAEVLEMTELTVKDCMVPRVQLPLIDASAPADKMAALLDLSHQRFALLHGETPDNVLGVIDIPQWKLSGRPPIHAFSSLPVFVHETASALKTFHRHLNLPSGCVLIIDEYGGLEGMLTQEEIIDWVLYDTAPWQGDELELRNLGQGRFMADGSVRVADVAEALNLDLPTDEAVDTLAGLVMNELGELPSPGRRVQLPGVLVTVRRVSKRRIQLLELLKQRTPQRTQEEEAEA
jgi:CBS domain containing-hemolysin-like protein